MNRPRRRQLSGLAMLSLSCAIAGLAGPHAAARSESEAPVVVVVPIEGELTDSMIATLDRAIETAAEEHATWLLVEIDTPGGAVTTMERIGDRLDRSEVPPVAFVQHEALSAGAYIAMACTRIYTREQAQIGSSMPIFMIPGLGVVPPEIDESMKELMEKQLSALRSKFRNRAELHDRPGMAALAEGMVDPSVEVLLVQKGMEEIPMTRTEYEDAKRADPTVRIVRTLCEEGRLLNLTAGEAFDLGFTDGIVVSREEVLDALGVLDARVIEVRPNWSERMVGSLQAVRWWLITIGLLLIAFELFFAPGTFVAGLLGVACLGIVFLSNYLVGLAELPEILLIVLGIGLLAIEIFVIPGFGFFGIAGLTCIGLGVLFSFLPFLLPETPVESQLLKTTLRNMGLSVLGSFLFVLVGSRFMVRKTPFLYRRLVLDSGADAATLEGSAARIESGPLERIAPGSQGVARTDLRPAGKVLIDGTVVDARSEGAFLPRGSRVRVVSVAANHVVVRAAHETARDPS